ncbi:unnamed protein product [Ectocarpus sp. 12 AP-2014]
MVNRIERPRSRGCVLLLGVAFLVAFIALLGIGDGAPNVLMVAISDDSEDSLTYRQNDQVNFFHPHFELSREHQLFWMDLRLGTGDGLLDGTTPLTTDVDMIITMHSWYLTGPADNQTTVLEEVDKYIVNSSQYCPDADADYCDFFFLFTRDFVDHEKFSLAIQFPDPDEYLVSVEEGRDHSGALFKAQSRVTAVNPDFTRFEIVFKYVWLFTTLFVMFCPCGVGFMSAVKRHRKDTGLAKTFHQKWTKALLWALVWFNDPFVWGTVYTGWAKVFSAVFILSASIFVFLILLFWLCFLSDLRCMRSEVWNVDRGMCYWIPKVLLTFAIGVTMFGGYMYYRFENTMSFDYTGVQDTKKAAEALAVLLGLMLSVYLLWIVVVGLRSCGRLRTVSPSFILLYCITLLTCLVAVIGVFVAAYYPYSTSAVAFVGIHGLLNLYVWTLAACFAPVRTPSLGMRDKPVSIGGTSAVAGTTRQNHRDEEEDISVWEDPADGDFKGVEL